MSYSNTSGGTLTLPSPTHVHHVDVGSAVRSLRRSLSRSPSKFQLARTASQDSDGSSHSPRVASPESPCPQPNQNCQNTNTPASTALPPVALHPQSPFATPFRSSVKLSLRSARPKQTSSKPTPRLRPSPKSPLKRALSITSDSGNSTTPTSSPGPESLLGQENSHFNSFALAFNQTPAASMEKSSRHSMHLDLSGASKTSSTRLLDVKGDSPAPSMASPLKRSDALMDFDQASLGSPVAKRRSLHGISSLGSDLGSFEQVGAQHHNFDIHEDSAREYQLSASASTGQRELSQASASSTMPKRSSSLRKSTLQQRHDPRSSWGRRQGEKYLAQQSGEISTPNMRSRPRASLDQFLVPDARESPFTARGPLPNPSVHALDRQNHQPHPLSRSLTNSSSNSSLPDESPTHFPVQYDRPRHVPNFGKSMPIASQRPREPIATPQYKSAKPFQAAFASTGLVSKMNRNPEQDPALREGGKQLVMPDTPCKKQVYPSNTYPPSSGSGRKQQRFSIPAAPETPFNRTSQQARGTFGATEKMGGLFKVRNAGHARKSSLLSLDGDLVDYQGLADGDLPPTPTKSVLAKNLFAGGKVHATPVAIRTLPPPTSAIGFDDRQRSNLSCKSKPPRESGGRLEPESEMKTGMLDTPAPRTFRPNIEVALSPFGPSRVYRQPSSSSPSLSLRTQIPLVDYKKNPFAKTVFPASPSEHIGSQKASPKTPQETMTPPDAGRLSISSSQDNPASQKAITFAPATPTADRAEAAAYFAERRFSITPVHRQAPTDVDEVLSRIFDKVEKIGKGEFSHVFRVAIAQPAISSPYVGAAPSHTSTSVPMAEQLYAVKKIRLSFSQRDRAAKLREVSALQDLKHRGNVLQLVDYWEERSHLYIQTEFCSEGSLEGFLKKTGEFGRLDDFRIWKILLEVSQGLKNVHDAGYIHLDLKPANIFITAAGHLKIGDFGMSSVWPAPRGIEGEGDREYIGPEILRGKFDKPADVFALGLIVLEIAANVFLPDNGPTWVALRGGDMTAVPSLTGNESSAIPRDATGMPIQQDASRDEDTLAGHVSNRFEFSGASTHNPRNLFGVAKPFGLEPPPTFMVDEHHPGSLDSLVSWMLKPDPRQRPTVSQVLGFASIHWVRSRSRAAATVYEGNWGPADLAPEPTVFDAELDTEMTDV